MPGCGQTSFSSLPDRWTTGLPALGLTQIQSIPGGAAIVPLVSTAISKPRAWSASINAASSCSKRLAAGDHDQPAVALGPQAFDLLGQRVGLVAPAILAIHADEIGVAEGAARGRAVLLAPGPQVAAGKAQEDRAAAGLHAFALQGEEDFLDRVAHEPSPACGSSA